MRADSFFQGLMQAVTDYADDCGLDGYALYTGGYKFDMKNFNNEDADYSHVRRKADFRIRVEKLLALFLEEQAALNKPPTEDEFKSVPVLSDENVAARKEKTKADALRWLAEFKWENLKSDDYATARRAWYHLDGLKAVCAMHDDTKIALKSAAERAGLTL